jgi:hypothetical protein
MMTGTPTPNGPEDAYGMAKLVNNANGESFYSYQDRVTTKISLYKRVPKSGSHAAAMALLQPSVRFSIDQCVDLPPMTVQQREVELSSEQQAAYKEMKNELVLQVCVHTTPVRQLLRQFAHRFRSNLLGSCWRGGLLVQQR